MHLGAAGWQITDGERVILLDPYLSRLRITGQFGTYTTPSLPGDTRRIFGPEDDLVGDEAAVDAHITRADFILHSHSHFNHTIDMPYIARKTGATVIGTESTINLARAGGVAESQLLAVHGGEDWAFGDFSVKVIPSLHSALNGKHFFDSRMVPRDFRGPRRLATDVEGGSLAYLLRLAGVVFATHWDEQSFPFGAPQDDRLREAEVFVREVKRVSPRTRVVLLGHFECHALPPKRLSVQGG
jgi:hypothetical protein